MSNQTEIRQRVTDRIVAALESGRTPPWRRPWSPGGGTSLPVNAATGSRYSGINIPILNMSAVVNGWAGKYWATYNQWRGMGCQVRSRPDHIPAGGYGTKIVFCRPVEKLKAADDGADREERYWVLREYAVFAAEQVDGAAAERLLARRHDGAARAIDFAPAEAVLTASRADIRHGGDRAFYHPTHDYLQLPPRAAFDGPVGYYSTALHELCHWTGHPSRLDRLVKNARFGSDAYAFEELCAEIGATYLSAELGVPQADDLNNSAAYLATWVRVLKGDPHAIFRAATMGGRAADFLLGAAGHARGDAELALAA